MREFKPISNTLFPTTKQKIERLNFILMQIDEMKELVVLDKNMKDEEKQKFLYMYINAASHIHALHFYFKQWDIGKPFKFIPLLILKLFKKK